MHLNLFYTMVQKSQKWPKTQIKGGGSCLNIEMQARKQILFVKVSATSALVQSSCTLSMLVLTFSVSVFT